MKKPVIGITVSRKPDKVEGFLDFVPSAYPTAVRIAGGIPLLIPNDFPLDELPGLVNDLAGVLLSGGGDVHPSRYQQELHSKTHHTSSERDALEIHLAQLAVQSDLPLLGICRGHQLLNIALGGNLYQHLPDERPSNINHSTPDSIAKDHIAHQVKIAEESALHHILEVDTLDVNSRHHQAVSTPAPNLKVTAYASDGLIEACELAGHRFCIGVQWHPENLQMMSEHKKVFTSFIAAASQ